jgi:hypothetical protein
MMAAVAGAGACSTQLPATVTPPEQAPQTPVSADASADAADADVAVEVDAACQGATYSPIPPDTCGDYVRFPCGLPEGITPRGDCFFTLGDCNVMCPGIQFNCHAIDGYCLDGGTIVPDDAGAVIIDCSLCAGSVGRVPEGLVPRERTSARTMVGEYFASVAHLEAASVFAFERFERELTEHEAPNELVTEARRARADEVRHARVVGRLARRFGGRYARPRVRPASSRDLESFARENAVEGCVRETFGALVATWQAAHARDREVAEAHESIAEDETRHAALSWAALRWSLSKLDAEARARVEAALERAASELCQSDDATPAVLVLRAGLPSREDRRRLVAALRDELWPSA